MSDQHQETIEMLQRAYAMEIETVINYLANSINLDGVRAEQIKKSLADDIVEEIQHAEQLGRRMKQLGGLLPGSATLAIGSQRQPPLDTTQVVGGDSGPNSRSNNAGIRHAHHYGPARLAVFK